MNNQSYSFHLIFGRFLRIRRNYRAEISIRIHLNLFFFSRLEEFGLASLFWSPRFLRAS